MAGAVAGGGGRRGALDGQACQQDVHARAGGRQAGLERVALLGHFLQLARCSRAAVFCSSW